MIPTVYDVPTDPCTECGRPAQRESGRESGTYVYRIYHTRTCHQGGYVDPVIVGQSSMHNGGDRYAHPAWGVARANVHSSTGSQLFDSDIIHSRVVVLTISRATRERSLHRDWIHAADELIEIEMSQAQWGALVSSFGQGEGVPVTITRDQDGRVSDVPYEPRLAESIAEVRAASATGVEPIADAYQEVMDLFEAGAGKKALRDALTSLGHQVRNAPRNMEFAAQSLTEHAENVITKAKADIEATVADAARGLGLAPGDVAQLGPGWDGGPLELAASTDA